MNVSRLLPIAVALLLASCTIENTAILTKSTGDLCDLHLRQQRKPLRAELLAVEADAVVVLLQQTVVKLPDREIRSVSIVGYSNTTEKALLIGLPGLGMIVGGVSVLSSGRNGSDGLTGQGVALLSFGLLDLVALLVHTPKTGFTFPLSSSDRDRLRLFARYQAGLTPDQWKVLLGLHGQESFANAP
jgi:hypothetical protein